MAVAGYALSALGGLSAGHCVPLLRELERQAELRLQLKEFGLWREERAASAALFFCGRSGASCWGAPQPIS